MIMHLYIGYEIGLLKHIYTSNVELDFPKCKHYACKNMNEVISCLICDNDTKEDIVRLINDKDTFILKDWRVVISHKVLINCWGNQTQIWIENDKGELELL